MGYHSQVVSPHTTQACVPTCSQSHLLHTNQRTSSAPQADVFSMIHRQSFTTMHLQRWMLIRSTPGTPIQCPSTRLVIFTNHCFNLLQISLNTFNTGMCLVHFFNIYSFPF